jgi:hypothetical protein
MEDEGDVLDEDGRARLKLKVENTLRWRKVTDEDGNESRESNARIVQWTDGRWVWSRDSHVMCPQHVAVFG